MGISRSTTVLAAYLMKARSLSPAAALSLIKQRRPQVQPNYGFVKQLGVFLACGYAPSATHRAYISWKKKHRQDVTKFLNHYEDCTVIIPQTLLLCSEFPSDPDQAELLPIYLGVTHLLTLAPTEKISVPDVHCRHIDVPPDAPDQLLTTLVNTCDFIRDAVARGGKVLVHSLLEARVCTVAGAYLMASRNISSKAAAGVIQDALPLFEPTLNFTRALALFAAWKCKPALQHPEIAGHKVSNLPPTSRAAAGGLSLQSTAARNAELLTQTAAAIMSETGIDIGAFGDALTAIQQKTIIAHSASALA